MSELATTIDNPPALARTPSRTATRLPGVDGALAGVRGLLAQPAVAKSLPAIGLIAMLGIAALLWMAFSTAPSRTLFAGLPEEEKAAVVEALRSGGVPHEIDSATGAVTVPEDSYHQARMLLAGQGLPRSGPTGSDVIQNLPLGSSRAVETERLRGAKEMDLARTIEAIDAVQTARIHLAVEQPSVFIRERTQPAASVMLTLAPGRTLSDQQVQAIVHLVASSVPGMSPDGVSVVDQNGRLLSRAGSGGLTAESERQVAVQAMIEDRYRQSVAALLTPILGAGNFTAEVHADVDFSQVQSTREGFPENARAVTQEATEMSTDGASTSAVGIPGTLSNQPPTAAEVAAQPDGTITPTPPGAEGAGMTAGRRTENVNRSFAVGREVSVTKAQTGTVKRLTVAVALRNPEGGRALTAAEIRQLEQLVKGAVGFDQGRGDVVALTARAFASTSEPEASWWEAPWMAGLTRNLTALAIGALVVFGLGRPLLRKMTAASAKRAEAQAKTEASVGSQMAAVIADEAKTDSVHKVTLEMIEATSNYEARAALIRNFVRQDPARAALVVRDLIRADGKGNDRNG